MMLTAAHRQSELHRLVVMVIAGITTIALSEASLYWSPGNSAAPVSMWLSGAFSILQATCHFFSAGLAIKFLQQAVTRKRHSPAVSETIIRKRALGYFLAIFTLLYLPVFLSCGAGLYWSTDPESMQIKALHETVRPWIDNPRDAIWMGILMIGSACLIYRIGNSISRARSRQTIIARAYFMLAIALIFVYASLAGSHSFYVLTTAVFRQT